LDNVANKVEFAGDTQHSTAAYKKVREDASSGSTPKLLLEASYVRGLVFRHTKATLPIEARQ